MEPVLTTLAAWAVAAWLGYAAKRLLLARRQLAVLRAQRRRDRRA